MYKLVTNDSLVHPLIALPFEGRLEVKGVDTKVICIPFGEECDTIKKVKEIVTDPVKMGLIRVFDGEEIVAEYKNYYALQQICTATYNVNGKEVEILMAKMSCESTIPEQINELRALIEKNEKIRDELENSLNNFKKETTENNNKSENTINEILEGVNETNKFLDNTKKTIDDIKHQSEKSSLDLKKALELSEKVNEITETIKTNFKTVDENMSTIRENVELKNNTIDNIEENVNELSVKVNGINEDDMDIDQLKEHRIALSKSNLHNYLAVTTVSSDIHDGVMAEYSITVEKQNQLMAMIMMANMNPDYQPSWNAKGEPCSYDWTVDELKYLAAQIEGVVRPLVSKQQHMETDIKNATTIDEVKNVDITF